MPLKLLGIAGSPRRGGNTEILLERVLEGAKSSGAVVEKLVVCDFKINPCRECNACFSLGRCVVQDEMQQIYPKLLEADRLAFASPIFFMGVTAQAKALIDRCQCLWAKKYVLNQPLVEPSKATQRKGVFISVGGTKGAKLFEGAIRTIKSFFDAIEMRYYDELLLRSVDEKGAIMHHLDASQAAFELGKRLAKEGELERKG